MPIAYLTWLVDFRGVETARGAGSRNSAGKPKLNFVEVHVPRTVYHAPRSTYVHHSRWCPKALFNDHSVTLLTLDLSLSTKVR